MNRARMLLVAVLVLVTMLGAAYIIWRGSGASVDDVPITAPPVDMAMQGVELTRSAGDGSLWTLKAESADYEKQDGRITVEAPVIDWTKEGREPVHIVAPKGRVDQATGSAELWPEVVVTSGDTTVYSKRLNYDGEARIITVREDVRIVREGMTLRAPEVVYDLSTNVITATGGVESVMDGMAAPGREK
ncbi:LPS export ABC transporter periplasmic protein LptC [Desulfobaculum sp.]